MPRPVGFPGSNRGVSGAGLRPPGLIFARHHPVISDPATDRVPAHGPVALSVVVPAHDEAPNLVRLVAEVRAALDSLGIAWELIVVDDGSDDDTPALLARLAGADHRLRPLRLARRSGQTAALVAGFRAARGRLIATLDADLQCAPAELPALLAALERADLASGVRTHRNDPPSRP